jgi:ribonuclease HI
MEVANVGAFSDSLLIVQQVRGESQCSDRVLKSYRDECMDMIRTMGSFQINHIPREKNERANSLAQ